MRCSTQQMLRRTVPPCMRAAAGLAQQATAAVTGEEDRAVSFLGLHWECWAGIAGGCALVLGVFFWCRERLPCWGWSLGLFGLAGTLLRLAWCALADPRTCTRSRGCHDCRKRTHLACMWPAWVGLVMIGSCADVQQQMCAGALAAACRAARGCHTSACRTSDRHWGFLLPRPQAAGVRRAPRRVLVPVLQHPAPARGPQLAGCHAPVGGARASEPLMTCLHGRQNPCRSSMHRIPQQFCAKPS